MTGAEFYCTDWIRGLICPAEIGLCSMHKSPSGLLEAVGCLPETAAIAVPWATASDPTVGSTLCPFRKPREIELYVVPVVVTLGRRFSLAFSSSW